ncbi:MAG TPA: ATP-binding protein [Candidatus Omnitrophota bacterium]|nr:ATP-binding protein [Candidatus Omnitrophota bacterium]
MTNPDHDYQSAHEIGKIFNSLLDRQVLSEFFLESARNLVPADASLLFLVGSNEQIWLEAQTGDPGKPTVEIEREAHAVLDKGHPALDGRSLFVPLLARNNPVGIACFFRKPGEPVFERRDLDLVFDLASQAASALKNLFLFEENVRMARLAAIGETVSMVMHEIKNILQIAKLSDELFRRGIKDKNQKFIDHGLEGMSKAIHQMDGFVWDMLSLTKDYKIECQKVDLKVLLSELEQDLSGKAKQLEVKLDFRAEDGLGPVNADNRSLYRAILNLAQNAMEACGKDESWVRIRAKSCDSESYEITIEDNGEGMSPEVKGRLFQAFFSTKGKQGTGLGLLIASRTFHAHHGVVQVESELGKGTLFKVTLPKNPS